MEGVTVVDHPLVQHKLTLIRCKNVSTKSFLELLKEIGMLLCYEVTRDLHPDVPIWTAAIDEDLDDRAFIVPGLGDAGDRAYGTK